MDDDLPRLLREIRELEAQMRLMDRHSSQYADTSRRLRQLERQVMVVTGRHAPGG